MNRGAGRRVVFTDDHDRELFLELLACFDQQFALEVHAYCLMGNHFHLLVRSRSGSLSDAMRWSISKFTRDVNSRRKVDGAIFRGRFHSLQVANDAHLTWLFRYINANPLELGWDAPLADYRWSGLARSLGRLPAEWLRTDFARSRFGDDPARLERFVEGARVPVDGCDFGAIPVGGVADVLAAAELARAPGPDVHSDADVRSVVVVVAVDRLQLALPDVLPEQTDDKTRRRSLQRARARVAARSDLQRFVSRVLGVLAATDAGRLGSFGV